MSYKDFKFVVKKIPCPYERSSGLTIYTAPSFHLLSSIIRSNYEGNSHVSGQKPYSIGNFKAILQMFQESKSLLAK